MLQILRTIGAKGQVVLPKDIRRHFNLRTGTEVVFVVQDDNVLLKPAIDAEEYVEEFCKAGKGVKKRTTLELKKLIEEEY